MSMGVSSACMSVPCARSAHGGQERALDPIELALQRFISFHWVLGTEPRYSARAIHAL